MISLLHQDTDKKFLEKTRRYLEKQGNFSMCSVVSLQDALTILETLTFDVIVSGYTSVQPDGIELLKALKTRGISVPFIFFSVPGGEKSVIEALNWGADYFLLKGDESETEFAQLQKIVEQNVTRSNAEQKIQNKIPDQNPDPVIRVSKEGVLTYANPAAYPMLERGGITIGQVMFDVDKGTVNKVLMGGTLLRTEMEAGEGSYLFTFKLIENEDGVTIYGHDTTEKKKTTELAKANTALKEEIAQRKLAESTTKKTLSLLNAALESTADGILVVDRGAKITSYNRKYVNMWDIPDSVLESQKYNAIVEYVKRKLKDPDGYVARVNELIEHPERQSYDMLELNDGRIFERYSKPQKIGNAVVGRVWNFRDVTDNKQAEENLLASLRDKEVMLREIHHRVKNNLQIVSGLLDMTRKRSPDPVTSGILMDMMMKIDTMAQIHTRLYESKQFNKIDMNTQIRDQIAALSNIYSSKDCEIFTTIESSSIFLPVDQAIPCALMVNEILTNAYKHAFKGRQRGTIEISALQEKGHMCITIRDDGIGISGNPETVHANSLGFKLIRALVQYQLKGSFTINNDNGTEVVVKFPIQRVSI
jgi:two-component sensor histidine kinase/DNA-binding NarL/FixJ family response regulator